MGTFNKEALDMPNLKNNENAAVSAASLRIIPITILAGLRVTVLRLGLVREDQYFATGELHFV